MGYRPEEVASPEWWMERLHPEDRESVLAKVPDLLAKGHLEREYRFRRPDGGYRWVRDEQKLLRSTSGRPAEVVGSWSDITERRQTELKLEPAAFRCQPAAHVGLRPGHARIPGCQRCRGSSLWLVAPGVPQDADR